ncbi:hypothetical protein [Holophaga foetida]|uniref:hypothetical protein n=1 Tax=Holophaga foetida TaxID=35839 RepID=UPI0002474951|nr:hypothetical protein [Holophaga foetida]
MRLLLLMFLNLSLLGGDEVTWHWKSPSTKIEAESKFVEADTPRVIWLYEPDNPAKKERLCSFERDAELIFSPDDSMVAMNDIVGSDLAEIRLFKRVNGLHYQELSTQVHDLCWALLQKRKKVPYPKALLHSYAFVKQWSPDSSAFLVNLSGHTDSNQYVEDWLCVFDLRTNRPTLDLSVLNRKSVIFRASPR